MFRMFRATVILFVMVASMIILYAVLADPLYFMGDLFLTVDETTTAQIEAPMNFILFLFGATIVFGVLVAFGIYAVVGHKKEFES